MELSPKKRLDAAKPVKAWKVLCCDGVDTWWTGPFKLEHVVLDEWVTAVDYTDKSLSPEYSPKYHAFKSREQARKALKYMARTGRLSSMGAPHYVVPIYVRGEVLFGNYYGKFKGVTGTQMLIKSKHIPEVHYVGV